MPATAEADSLRDLGALGRLGALRRRVVAAGYSHRVAGGLVAWLVAYIAGDDDDTASDTRARYRTILRELSAPDDDEGNAPRSIEDRWAAWILHG